MNPPASPRFTALLLCLALFLAVGRSFAQDSNLLLGNPSKATSAVGNKNNYLMPKEYFTLSYNNKRGEPNWVSWSVKPNDLGTAARELHFATDTTLPAGFKRIVHEDYNGCGFDRGHMCPHSDRAATKARSSASFVMTNIIPQAPGLNEDTWKFLEDYGRTLVKNGTHLYIISGPAGSGGNGLIRATKTIPAKAVSAKSIAQGKVNVPAACWKIIVVVPPGSGTDLSRINANTRVISVLMPNDQNVARDWTKFRTSPAEIEKRTRLHFFTSLSPAVRTALEKQVDAVTVPATKPTAPKKEKA